MYGLAVDRSNFEAGLTNTEGETPESKCNTVSFMKIDDIAKNCRNLLAVSDCYICYAVSGNRSLRVIQKETGEKSILRGYKLIVFLY